MLPYVILQLGAFGFLALYQFATASAYWAVYWLFWFFGVFLVPEVYWVIANSANTVSGETWSFESLSMTHPYDFAAWSPVHWTFAVVYFIFMALLGYHLIFGVPR